MPSPFTPESIPSNGASYPASWTVGDAGDLTVTLVEDVAYLTVQQPLGALVYAIALYDGDSDVYFRAQPSSLQLGTSDALPTGVTIQSVGTRLWGDVNNDANFVIHVKAGDLLGFFGTAPVAKPTGVPVTAAGIHAALVTLGLIAA